MVAKFLDHNNGELKQQQRRWQRERQKKTIDHLDKQNNNFARDHAFLVHFLVVIARLRHKTS